MPHPLRSPLLPAMALSAAALLLAGCKEEVVTRSVDPTRPVKVVTLADHAQTVVKSYSGVVRARADSALGFRVGGKIVARLVDVGDHVVAGTPIARLDAVDLKLSVDAALANVESARTRKDLATDELSRAQALAQKGFATRSLLDKATAELEQATSALNVAAAARDQAQNQAAYSELRADAAGIVTEIRQDVGQVVTAGTPVAVIARDGEKEVAFAVPEQDVDHLGKGQPVRVRPWADRSTVIPGTIREIAGSADALSRTFAVRVVLPADVQVRLGMTATVDIDQPNADRDVVVPLAALADKAGETVVWVVERGANTVAARKVAVGRTSDTGVRVLDGLAPGETVVAAGTQFMRDGLKVRIAGSETTAALKLAATP